MNNKKINRSKRLCFILSCWGDSHQLNKVVHLEKNGIFTRILAFTRKEYYASGIVRNFELLGVLSNRNKYSRFKEYFKGFFKLFKALRHEKMVYVFGIDNILFVTLYKKIFKRKLTVIYEVPDLRSFQFGRSIKTSTVRTLEKILFKQIDLFVFTSEAFYTEHYQNVLEYPINYTVIENKINNLVIDSFTSSKLRTEPAPKNAEICIGYFGLLRCERSLELLIDLAKSRTDIKIELRGIFMPNTKYFQPKIEKIDRINYYGPYVSPIDLPEMYKNIDISWICYPYSNQAEGNWRLAKTNRFYEAGYYATPMIASNDTKDGRKVEEFGIGLVLNLEHVDRCLASLINLEVSQINKWKANLKRVETSNFEITDDYGLLLEFCRKN